MSRISKAPQESLRATGHKGFVPEKVSGRKGNRARGAVRGTWCWRRWILSRHRDFWTARLEAASLLSWAFVERPGRARVLLEVYVGSSVDAAALARHGGGRIRFVDVREWSQTRPSPPTAVGRELQIIHERTPSRSDPARPTLVIPHGLAFGSGDHATTYLLLRALIHLRNRSPIAFRSATVLDLGTGSGVLALAARLFGARRIAAIDFDPDAIRTARENEALNFSGPLIRWRQADLRRLRATARYELVLANLFSGILAEAAPQIARSVSPGGQLWLSGILKSQQQEVIAAYREQGMTLIRTVHRGRWVLLILGAVGYPIKKRPGAR
jgi:ribosomal protein L11 methyltransferase